MIELLALALASAQDDPSPVPCAYGIEHFVGFWRPDPADDVSENDTSVIEFSLSGGSRKWRQYLHYRQLDEGRWSTAGECGTVTLLSPTGAIIVGRFKVVAENRIQLERTGQIYTRAASASAEIGE